MSITLTSMFVIVLPASLKLVTNGNAHLVETVENELEGTVEATAGNDWADEALLDVAFYLRLHKFNDFDRR